MTREGRIGGLLNRRPISAIAVLTYFGLVPKWIGGYFGIPPYGYEGLVFALIILVLVLIVEAVDRIHIVKKTAYKIRDEQ